MRQTFSLTLVLFLLVWAFFAIDLHLGMQRREVPKEAAGPALEEDAEYAEIESESQETADWLKEDAFFKDALALNLEEDFLKMLAADGLLGF